MVKTIPGAKALQRWSIAALSLLAGNLILLAASWFVSASAYDRLPPRISSWSGPLTGHFVPVETSWLFFAYPIGQAVFFVAYLVLTRALFFKGPRAGRDSLPPTDDAAVRLRSLKREVAYLALIFFNLVFIHLQTSLILLSRSLAPGINKAYFFTLLVMILFILGPYYRIRRKIMLAEQARAVRPR